MSALYTDPKGMRLPTAPPGWPFGRVPPQPKPIEPAPF